MCTMMDFCSSFVSVHVYFSVPLNLITRCDCDTFGMNRNNSRGAHIVNSQKIIFPSLSFLSVSQQRTCACMDASVCAHAQFCVCVSYLTGLV